MKSSTQDSKDDEIANTAVSSAKPGPETSPTTDHVEQKEKTENYKKQEGEQQKVHVYKKNYSFLNKTQNINAEFTVSNSIQHNYYVCCWFCSLKLNIHIICQHYRHVGSEKSCAVANVRLDQLQHMQKIPLFINIQCMTFMHVITAEYYTSGI